MAYQALYRKYRPTNFDEVVGQKHIVQTLKNAVATNRIGHAYLFCGPRGTGKTSIAKIFARMLNCEDRVHAPCGICDGCKMASDPSYPDIIEIDAASNNGVDEVRNLIERVKYAPMQGKYKVYIIDEVHMMSTGAFNALLKTIEEPPAHVIFIFATTEPHKVLPTIISRCQRFDFSKVSIPDIEERLHTICEKENIKIEDEAILLIAKLCDGGMRDALSILDECIAYCSSTITQKDVRDIYGVMTTEDIGKLYKDLYEKNVDAVIQTLQDASNNGMDLKRLTGDFISLLKDSIIVSYSDSTTLVSHMNKEVIHMYMESTSLDYRIDLMEELMNTYNKFNFASNILDYLEGSLLKTLSKSYESNSKGSDRMKIDNQESQSNQILTFSHEKPSEKSDIQAKLEEKAEKKAVLNKSEKYDVSHETMKSEKKVQKEISEITFSDEYILGLLVGANKNERKDDCGNLRQLEIYLADMHYAKFAASLRGTSVVASGNNYMIVCTNHILEARSINELEATYGYEAFTKQLLGKEKKVIAIEKQQHIRVIQSFKNHMKEGTLPDPIHITLNKKDEETNREASEEDKLKSIFPTIEIIDD